jgi:hypothetical protein
MQQEAFPDEDIVTGLPEEFRAACGLAEGEFRRYRKDYRSTGYEYGFILSKLNFSPPELKRKTAEALSATGPVPDEAKLFNDQVTFSFLSPDQYLTKAMSRDHYQPYTERGAAGNQNRCTAPNLYPYTWMMTCGPWNSVR